MHGSWVKEIKRPAPGDTCIDCHDMVPRSVTAIMRHWPIKGTPMSYYNGNDVQGLIVTPKSYAEALDAVIYGRYLR